MKNIEQLNQLIKEKNNISFLLNEILNEKNTLQKEYNEETNPFREPTPEEEAERVKKVKMNRISLLVCLVVCFAGFGVVLHLATYGFLYQTAMAIVSGCIVPFFFYGLVIFFFCDFKSFGQLDYEHEDQYRDKRSKIRKRKPSKRATVLAGLIKEKNLEYNSLYKKLQDLEIQIKDLDKQKTEN